MTDKTEDKLAQERAAVEAMRNAKSNMASALARVETLESTLRNAQASISRLKGYIAPNVYTYPVSGNSKACTTEADDAIAMIAKVLA
jgi:multidrug resistance efflux pump